MYQATISQDRARILLEQGAQLVDVRPAHEFAHGALPGSVNIPLPDIQRATKQLNKDTPVLLYCSSGQLSGTARQLLQAWGFHQVHNLGARCDFVALKTDTKSGHQ
jgi:phage shock protein E